VLTLSIDPKEVESLWKSINMNNDDTIEFTEFLAASADFTNVDCANVV